MKRQKCISKHGLFLAFKRSRSDMVREKWMIFEKSQGKVREKSGILDILYEPCTSITLYQLTFLAIPQPPHFQSSDNSFTRIQIQV